MHSKNQKGFTLVEILVVIAIISILFVVLLPLVNNAFIKANEAGVKTNFHDFQLATETFLREGNGKNLDSKQLNLYLDKAHELKMTDTAIITTSVDAWGNPYRVEFGDSKITFYSNGKTEKETEKAYVLVSYYYKGEVSSCTTGFINGNLILSLPDISETFKCGENLPDSADGPTGPETDTLPAPTGFKATNVTNRSATLSWDRVVGATQYILKRNGTTIYIGSSNSFADVGLNPNVSYTYEVAAWNSKAMSDYSSIIVKTLAGPNAPTNFRASNMTENSIDLSWNAVANATGYILYRNGTPIYSGSSTSYKDTGLTPYTTYDYELVATNESGVSSPVNTSAKTLASEETVKLPNRGRGSCNPYDPYIITTLGELQAIYMDLDACYELGNDINAVATRGWHGGKGFAPIYWGENGFSGKLDGKGYTVHDLFMARFDEHYTALFKWIGEDSEVKNINFNNVNITGNRFTAVIVGYAEPNSLIENITASGNIKGTNETGGIAGYFEGNSNNITSTANVTGNDVVGGIMGANTGNSSNLNATGTITATNQVGGVIGSNNEGTLANVSSSASITANNFVGGIVGYFGGNGNDFTSSATITAGNHVGGNVGYVGYGTLEELNSSANLTANDFVGGVVGYVNTGILEQLTSTANVTAKNYVGGAIGENYGTISFASSTNSIVSATGTQIGGVIGYNEGDLSNLTATDVTVSGETEVGGAVGMNILGSVTDSHATGEVSGHENVGGLIGGSMDSAKVENSSSLAIVSGYEDVGGLVGENSWNSTITNSYAEGLVDGTVGIGGLVGWNYHDSTVEDSHATGAVSGVYYVGGLIGGSKENTIITNSFAKGNITGDELVGGLVGLNDTNSFINSSYAKGTATGEIYVGGFVGANIESRISRSYATGNVTGDIAVGGFVGSNYINSLIENAYTTSMVIGRDAVGGFVGENIEGSHIQSSYASGSLIGNTRYGGFFGVQTFGTITNSYVNSDNYPNTNGATGLTSAQMREQSSYLGWDFNIIWGMSAIDEGGLPYLK